MKIKYKIETDGQATNLQFVKDDYAAGKGETIIEGNVLPDIYTLHTQVYKDQSLALAAEEQEIADNLANTFKNWAAVEKDIKAITDIEGVKAILLKYFKIDYQHIKKKKD